MECLLLICCRRIDRQHGFDMAFAYGRKISVKEHWIWWFVDSRKKHLEHDFKEKNKV